MDFQTFKRPLRRAAKLLGELLDEDDSLPDGYEEARVEGDDADAPRPDAPAPPGPVPMPPQPPAEAPRPDGDYFLVLEGYKEAMAYRAALPTGVLQAYALPVNGEDIQWELANLIMQRELHLLKFVVMLCTNDTEGDAEAIGKRAINLWHGLDEHAGLVPPASEDGTNDGG